MKPDWPREVLSSSDDHSVEERTTRAQWDTSTLSSDLVVTQPAAFDGLEGHADDCRTANGRWFDLVRRIDALRAVLARRPITVVVVILALTGLALWLWHPFPSI